MFACLLSLFVVSASSASIAFISQTSKNPAHPHDLLRSEADQPAAVAEFFRALGQPLDRIQLANGETIDVEPLSTDVLLDPEFAGSVTAREVGAGGNPGRETQLSRATGAQFIPYEQQVMEASVKFEKAGENLPVTQRLAAMETGLTVALQFSLGARDRPLKGTNRWAEYQARIDRKLLEVRRDLLRDRVAAARSEAQWQDALRYADTLLSSYPGESVVLADVARQRLGFAAFLASETTKKQDTTVYAAIRRQLDWVDDHLWQPPRPDASEPPIQGDRADAEALRQLLIRKATALRDEAKQTKDGTAAEQMLQAALEIWPNLPGLRDEMLKQKGKYAVLNVGVRALPRQLSPARAVADVELQSLDLLFEALVQQRPADDGSLIFVPQLAASLPQMLNNERFFPVKKTARWSNGNRVSSADVQKTFELVKKLPGRSAELADQLELLRAGDDPFVVQAKLRVGLLEPLAPFTFKVLPRDPGGTPLAAADDEGFAFAPVGSGPYMLAGRISEHGRDYLRFVVNPYYHHRAHPTGPSIREIRFFVSRDPAADFANRIAPLHLLLDVPTQDLPRLKAAGPAEVRTMPTRRVHFIAVNHRDPVLADEAPRRALAHGINRSQVLADCFGGGRPSFRTAGIAAWGASLPVMAAALQPRGATLHHPLNGPYPFGSWACCTDSRVPASLFDVGRAETFLQKTKDKALELELKYPDDDPRVRQACHSIAVQLAELGDRAGRTIRVRLVSLPVHELKRDLDAHRYQLAYWHHDFPDDAFSLWPLFDPRPEAITTGSNYLGFKDDVTLPELLQKAASYRDFREVKRLTHEIHAVLFERMPLIPLWQLEYHVAVHPNLRLPRIDPLRVFANVEEWQLKGN
jgi:ABC-type transport system substrate-binding protein